VIAVLFLLALLAVCLDSGSGAGMTVVGESGKDPFSFLDFKLSSGSGHQYGNIPLLLFFVAAFEAG
jgi:hypothetical protein